MQELYLDHHPWLQSLLRKRLGNRDDAADLAHDTFIRVLRSQEDVRELRQPMAFLATIANGLLINRWRRQAIERAYLEALAARPVGEEPSPEERHLMIETLLQLDSLLVGLSARVRQIFFLSQLDGLTYPQIAERLNISVRSVNNYMAKAMEHCCLMQIQLELA